MNISTITQSLENLFSTMRNPANIIPSIIMLCAMVRRPGLSCALSSSNIIQNVAKHGCETGEMEDGSPNLMNLMITETVCEIFRALKEDANIQVAIGAGSVQVTASGGNGGGPVTVQGSNTNNVDGVGLMQ